MVGFAHAHAILGGSKAILDGAGAENIIAVVVDARLETCCEEGVGEIKIDNILANVLPSSFLVCILLPQLRTFFRARVSVLGTT